MGWGSCWGLFINVLTILIMKIDSKKILLNIMHNMHSIYMLHMYDVYLTFRHNFSWRTFVPDTMHRGEEKILLI